MGSRLTTMKSDLIGDMNLAFAPEIQDARQRLAPILNGISEMDIVSANPISPELRILLFRCALPGSESETTLVRYILIYTSNLWRASVPEIPSQDLARKPIRLGVEEQSKLTRDQTK